ncbi:MULTISPECIES: response regulator FixJ [Methylosinus]|uniref:DNA-binding response regulator n=1 Tax=Methylosinus trichosporium (strain ATCC 35070 / NCIMB 11131 / UNIQEM 75 / OB3b) TaxID=595536 RepID=A0A2D2D463_METT3|nr:MULTISPECIES: response regulator FixJ [Methylosinus]ATQ69811.1 DNA-binding response regulator [Methylosinus trichosporium OB3b]
MAHISQQASALADVAAARPTFAPAPGTTNEHATVHIIDDDDAVRDSLALLLSTEGLRVEAHESASVFLTHVQPGSPGCVVTDARMPEMTGIELLEEMKTRQLSLPVVVITAYADVDLAVQAMKQGAFDFLEKPFDNEALIACVRLALAFEREEQFRAAETQTIQARMQTLTARESEVLARLLDGMPNKSIGRELGISVRTVEVHRANVMLKMNAGSLSELVRMSLAASAAAAEQPRGKG